MTRKVTSIRVVLCLAAVGAVATAASPASGARDAARVPARVWGVEVTAAVLPKLTPTLVRGMERSGVNVLFARRGGFSRTQAARLVALARRSHLLLVEPVAPPATPAAAAALRRACAQALVPSRCATWAGTLGEARSTVRGGKVAFSVLHVKTPAAVGAMRPPRSRRSHLVAVVRLPQRGTLAPAAWRHAIAVAKASPSLGLAVSFASATSVRPLQAYLTVLATANGPTIASVPPSGPGPSGLAVATVSSSSITVSWAADGASSYGVYRDGVLVGTTSETSFTVSGLACQTGYRIEVDAVDSAGSRSSRSSVQAQTAACAGGGGGGGGGSTDLLPPSAPLGLVRTSATASTVTIAWSAASDNIGVAGYGVYRNGSLSGSTASTSYTLGGLACATSYSIAVDAYDAAGNRSARTSITAGTGSCPSGDTTAPTAPGNLSASTGVADITLNWSAASDNVGVAGYTVYNGGSQVATTAATTYTISGLACATGYSVSVDAYDAAGNHSAKAAVAATTGSCPAPPPPGSTLYLSPSGSDANACSQAAPCKSFDRAYHAAAPGQVVELAAGSYPQQSITNDASKPAGAAHVVFQPASGASVTVGQTTTPSNAPTGLTISASHLTISGIRVPFYEISGSDVTMQNVNGDTWYVSGSQVSVLGGVYGPYSPPCSGSAPMHDNPTITPGGSTPTGDVVRGAAFHDMNDDNCAGSHMDCLQVAGASNLDIDGNEFVNCYSNDLILTGDFGVMNNITVENNWFGPTLAGNRELNWNATKNCPNALVRYNTLGGVGMQFVCNTDGTAKAYGNIVPRIDSFECGSSAIKATQDYEVASAGTAVAACGAHSYVAPDGQVDLVNRQADGAPWQNLDYHLTSGSEAIGRGNPNAYPTDDFDGQSRPQNGAVDAGADER